MGELVGFVGHGEVGIHLVTYTDDWNLGSVFPQFLVPDCKVLVCHLTQRELLWYNFVKIQRQDYVIYPC